jgi:hypothetical protein
MAYERDFVRMTVGEVLRESEGLNLQERMCALVNLQTCMRRPSQNIKLESLILAQNERWRQA